MGTPDSVTVPCPKCGDLAYFQSKGGPNLCLTYDLADAPEDVMSNVNRHAPYKCECGAVFYVDEETRTAKLWDGPDPGIPDHQKTNWFYSR